MQWQVTKLPALILNGGLILQFRCCIVPVPPKVRGSQPPQLRWRIYMIGPLTKLTIFCLFNLIDLNNPGNPIQNLVLHHVRTDLVQAHVSNQFIYGAACLPGNCLKLLI